MTSSLLRRTAVFGLLALVPGVARADVGVSLRQVPVQVTLTVDRDYPGVIVFVVEPERKQVRRASPTPDAPVVLMARNGVGPDYFAEVFVVPEAEVANFDRTIPPTEWFEQTEHHKYAAGTIHVRSALQVFDNRERIEKTYVLKDAGEAYRVELLSENKGSPWVKGAWFGLCCGLPPLALALAGVWVARLSNRKRQARRGKCA